MPPFHFPQPVINVFGYKPLINNKKAIFRFLDKLLQKGFQFLVCADMLFKTGQPEAMHGICCSEENNPFTHATILLRTGSSSNCMV